MRKRFSERNSFVHEKQMYTDEGRQGRPYVLRGENKKC